MTEQEINEQVEKQQKKLEEYNLQIESLTRQDNPESEEAQAKFDYLLRRVSETIDEIETLVSKIK